MDVGELGARVKFEVAQGCAKWLAVKTADVITKKKILFRYAGYTYTISRERTTLFCATTIYIRYEIRTCSTVVRVLYKRLHNGMGNLESSAKKKDWP
jgi:ABC-type transport system involved in Fe-S cluster assembly fused permease/ATPase subunit